MILGQSQPRIMTASVPSRASAIRPAMAQVWDWANAKADAAQAEAGELREAWDAMLAQSLAEPPSQHEIVALRAVQKASQEADDRLALAQELVIALSPFMGA